MKLWNVSCSVSWSEGRSQVLRTFERLLLEFGEMRVRDLRKIFRSMSDVGYRPGMTSSLCFSIRRKIGDLGMLGSGDGQGLLGGS